MATLVQAHAPLAPAKPNMLSAMRSPNFRLYFAGQVVSISGTWIQAIAQGYLVFLLTKSELWLGIVACAAGLPVLLLSPVGGVVIDRFPRRTILMFTQGSQMILAFILAWLTFAGTVQVWHIVVLAFGLGITNAFDVPARQLIIVEMVGQKDMNSGIALNSIMNNGGRIVGPAIAGLLLVQLGASWCFLINGLSFIAVLISLFLMKVPFAVRSTGKVEPIRQLREGVSYSLHQPAVLSLLLLTSISGALVFPLTQMMPAFADVVLHSPDQGYAAINAATGIGAVIGGVLVGWLAHRFGFGRLIVITMLLTGLAMVLFAAQVSVLLASFISGVYGIVMLLQFVTVNTSLQMILPDDYRGRVMGLYSLGLVGLTPFGALALGAISNTFGTPFGIALYGIISAILGSIVVMRWPALLQGKLTEQNGAAPVLNEVILPSAIGD
ncbi:MAG: MFS transporter [Chloroflexi bacterium]|nr:MFS transporter [Chloroflexota bacterium]